MTAYDEARIALGNVQVSADTLGDLLNKYPVLLPLAGELMTLDAAIQATGVQLAAITPPSLMPLVSGLFVEGTSSPVPEVTNTMCNVKWSELQLTKGGPIVHPNPIDTWAKGKVGHVRLFFGRHSPAFALALGKVTIHDPTDGVTADVPKWWQVDIQGLQKDLVSKLALEYDGKISLIFMATPMTVYAEPFIRGIADAVTRHNLLAAGYNIAADQASFDAMLAMFAAFKRTRLGLALNPHQEVKADGSPHANWPFTQLVADTARATFGAQFHMQNNSIRTPMLGGLYPTMYAYMNGKKPLGFQTAIESRIGDWYKTIQWAISQGAHSVELSPHFQNHLTSAQLKSLDAALKGNA